ncbi:glutamate--tRNA ligase [Candidatus Micrarchaeota archaeon RBG_16_36_9]|nr:MAG: glutamate--tRNA ligase [Candidatus Micrarchaeota archaeon RBG_16_36_9]
MQDAIKKHALINAVEYEGKANPQAIMGKILAENPELKKDMASLGKEISKIVKEVNSWTLEKQKKELEKFGKIEKPKKEQREGLPPLKNAEMGKVVTRIPPEPSKYNHIGHALSFLINYLYAKMYKGKCILRFEDTNPDKVKKEYVDAMKEDVLEYLDIKPDKTVFSSNDIPKMYEYAEKLIKEGKAYVCTCSVDETRNLRHQGIECKHRGQNVEENLKLWKDMLGKKFKDGEAALRLKIDMQALNQALRDPAIFRIAYVVHFLQNRKYHVWPLYDFQNVVEDEICGITHIFRSSEFRLELQNYIKDLLGFRMQTVVQYGRFEVEGAITQGREIRKLIEEGKIKGWDDPRLVTLKALRKRGIVKETYYKLAEKLGLNPTSAKIQWHMIASENRKIIDSTSNRYFFVGEPIEITLNKVPKKIVKAPLLPGKKTSRKIPVTKKIFVDKIDFVQNKGKEVRLMHFCNIILDKKAKVTSIKLKDVPKIHWVSSKNVKIKLVMPDAHEVEGLAEPDVSKIKPNQTVQFERLGFCRVDKVKPQIIVYYAHK